MRRYLLLLGLFTLLGLGHPQASKAQLFPSGAGCQNANTGTGSTVSCVVTAPGNTLGRAQIVAVKWCDTDNTCTVSTAADTIAITDGAGNSYTLDKRLDASSGTDRRSMAVYHAQNIVASTSNTVTLTVTSLNPVTLAGIIVTEIVGGTASVTVDASGTTDLAANPSPVQVSTSGATTVGNELVYTWVNIDAGTLAIGQPIIGAMGTNYPNRQIGTPTNTGSGTTAMDEWNNRSPRNTIKTETMSFSAPGFTLNPTAQERGIIVTYFTPMQVQPASLTFKPQPTTTTSASQTITLINSNTGNIHFNSNAGLTGPNAADFAISGSSTCVNGLNLGVGLNCSIIITFTPSATGTRTATLTINTSATGSPHVMTLSGTGM